MFHNSSLSFASSVQRQIGAKGSTPAYRMIMQYYAGLQLMVAGVEYVPYDLEQTRNVLRRDGEWYPGIRQLFLDCQRVSFHVRHKRLDDLQLEVRWFRRAEERECGELTIVIDQNGVPLESSFTSTNEPR